MADAKKTQDKFRRPLLKSALAVAATAAVAGPAPVLAETFLKLGDIVGESVDSKHKGEIEVLSFSQSFINTLSLGTGGGGGAGKVECGPITMMKSIDSASPMLLKGVATGEHFPQAVITFRANDIKSAAAPEYYVITMKDVFVTELSQTDSADPNRIFEKVVLNARSFDFKYTPTSVKGSLGKPVSFKYDCASNKAS
ncbi:MAG TPA: type VI secretion system tube protein Hcp [Usitatibacter sp.]|nr:type VI secretion system tube protein Hcp [Usitatibacter sp.]